MPDEESLPSWIDKSAWQGFVEMRKSIKKPLTKRAIILAINKLENLLKQGQDPTKVLDQSTFHSWQGLFPVKEENNGPKDGGSGGRSRNFAEERQKQRDESNARILSKYNRVPGGVHREAACGEGKGNVVIENDAVSVVAIGPLRTVHRDTDE